MQGCLRRKTILKDGKKPAVTSWQRYWVQLWGSSMVFFSPKGFKGVDRNDFKKEPCKMVRVVGWTVCLTENPLQPDLFQLADHQRGTLSLHNISKKKIRLQNSTLKLFFAFIGNVYKFRSGSKSLAFQWCRQLLKISGEGSEKPLPANLMSFEWCYLHGNQHGIAAEKVFFVLVKEDNFFFEVVEVRDRFQFWHSFINCNLKLFCNYLWTSEKPKM